MTKESSAARSILVIDEDPSALETTRVMLEGAGYRVFARDRSAGSISAIVREKPDVVLAELNMARLTGETISKILNKTSPRPPVVVLLYSALPIETLRLKALAAGAQGYVQKTDNTVDLVRRIEHCVANAGSLSKNRMIAVAPVETSEVATPMRMRPPTSEPRLMAATRTAGLKVLFVDDDWSLLRAYRAALGSDLQAEFLTSGEEAAQRVLSSSPPDIVVCDIVMPFVTGADLYSQAVKADPSWRERFLFLTGASSTRVVVDFLNDHEGRVLFKPVPANRLLETINKMLAKTSPR
jgi:CheY-like chemotaxis protein